MCESLLSVKTSLDVIKPSLHAVINHQDDGHRHQRMLDNLIEGILIIDNLGRIIQSNAPMIELLGHLMDEIKNQNIASLLNDYELKTLRRVLARQKQGHNFRKEVEISRKDGTKLQTVMQISPLEDSEENPDGLFISVLDISRRKHIEEILKKTEKNIETSLKTPLTVSSRSPRMDGFSVPIRPWPEYSAMHRRKILFIPSKISETKFLSIRAGITHS